MAIEGRVARILTDESLVINRGSSHGVRAGMRFVVFAELDEVKDPETGGSLGRLELVKGRLVASHVQETMTTCVAEREAAPPALGDDPSQHTLSAEMVAVSMISGRRAGAKLNVDRASVSGVPRAGPIAVGDKVRSTE